MCLLNVILAALVPVTAFAQNQITADSPFQVSYAANLNIGESYINITNTGSNGAQLYGPDFGSIPDFNEPPKGVRFADIREGSPAAKAGLKPGDIMIEFGGKPIGNLYDFTYALRDSKAGDTVLVKVLRGDQTIEAKVLLTERR